MKRKNSKAIKFKKSFTLIELLIAVFIFSMTTLIVVATFTSATSYMTRTKALRETTQTGRGVMETLAREIRLADDFQIPVPAENRIWIKKGYIVNDFGLVLDSITQNSKIQFVRGPVKCLDPDCRKWSIKPDYTTLSDVTDPKQINVNELKFTLLGEQITIFLSLKQGDTPISLQTTVTKRSYK